MHVHENGYRGINCGDGFDGQHGIEEASSGAAQVLGNLDGHDAEVEELFDQARRDLLLVVHGAHQGRDVVLGELAHAGVEQVFFFGELGERRGLGIGLGQQ